MLEKISYTVLPYIGHIRHVDLRLHTLFWSCLFHFIFFLLITSRHQSLPCIPVACPPPLIPHLVHTKVSLLKGSHWSSLMTSCLHSHSSIYYVMWVVFAVCLLMDTFMGSHLLEIAWVHTSTLNYDIKID